MAASGVDASAYADAFATALEDACRDAVGLKTIAAYRGGFDFDPAPPTEDEVVLAAGAQIERASGGDARLTDVTLLRHGIWTGICGASNRSG